MSVRRVRPDGYFSDLIGFVVAASAAELRLQDRRGETHQVPWAQVHAWRPVGVARGRDPMRTPLAELDRQARLAGLSGRYYVARLSDLLDSREPMPGSPPSAPPPSPAEHVGEWVVAAPTADLIALAWWAAHRDARSLLLVAGDPADHERLLSLGMVARLD
ncbi:MAG TPA: hypothetical protein PLL50_00170 [Propionicimonas sp.]|nr:hypothetical protein [Propionicimonas sp.]HQA76751.1 hypothetical protein [Propionicimonas sp.]HQD96280.1 hypothetical protein [Propionicimonas sp.]